MATTRALRYVNDRSPGLSRRRAGDGFAYVAGDGATVDDADVLRRIAGLAIPPAWEQVWIAGDPRAHIQATGRDARGRKQYRYHAVWHERRSRVKFERLAELGTALPKLRRGIESDLRRPGLPRERVLALVVSLLDRSGARIGNAEYRRTNGSFGLTTLRDQHLSVRGSRMVLEFRGKSGVMQRLEVDDRRLAKLARRCQELPGQTLFQYVDDGGKARALTSQEVNAYLRRRTGLAASTKDVRTWQASSSALRHLCGAAPKSVHEAVAAVAHELGNTKTVCRKFYIHPKILELYAAGRLQSLWEGAPRRAGLAREECALLALVQPRPRALAA